MIGRILRMVALGLFAAASAAAEDPVSAFHAWAAEQGAGQAAIAILRDAELVTADNADSPLDLASNSKAITALCILSLVEEGTLAWDLSLSAALGEPAPDATLAELVTHSAGIAPDGTQWRMGFWLNETEPRHAHVTRIVLDRRTQRGTRGVFLYNNENYALLGRIVEIATGEPYETACRRRVLDPAGVAGALSSRFAAFAAWGGWRMTMADHARLVDHWFGRGGRVGADTLALPHAPMAGGAAYGLGMIHVRDADGMRLSHAGAIFIPLGPRTGSYVTVMRDGTVVAVAYDVAVTRPERFRALDRALAEALSRDRSDRP
ncbi:serine hydrolase domain-containing protein [Thetidibacter halocola]|uniref:Beta-lactamase family protein n=1 Tax=Thetidibacter halocola TaxID=2827239 RepID=A0A8J7WH37_9RHOB|nr:serine hydrolase domain-containing protein [Thetidibacter halocola]MBS0125216.1 beta-lactamase family protein [Thetidibacter halocola]